MTHDCHPERYGALLRPRAVRLSRRAISLPAGEHGTSAQYLCIVLRASRVCYSASHPGHFPAVSSTSQSFWAYSITGLAELGFFAGAMRFVIGESVRDSAFTALAASWSNWGYMGIPLISAILGQAALVPLIASGMAGLLVVTSTALALASLGNQSRNGVRKAVTGALIHVTKNSLAWAVIAGGVFSAMGLRLPPPMDQFTRLLGEAAGPVALFTIGASLYRPSTPVWRLSVLLVAAFKLALHPFLVGVITTLVFRLTQFEVHTLVLTAALPVAGTVFLFAERQGANPERIAAAILLSTALAFATFSIICWTLQVQLPS